MVKKRNKIKSKKTRALRTETWRNEETGETKQIGNTKIKVLMYILDNISPYDNTFCGTVREIAKESETSTATVQRVLNILTNEADFLVKIRVAQYQVNPNIIAKGGSNKRLGLMVHYEKNKSKTK